ncbi:Uncharacterised protein [Mannheimia haemolytica]|nr:Uncharacterised protein [Mannheimia haemolytica]
MTTEINYEGIEQMPIKRFTEDAYLNYSMYVNYGPGIAVYWRWLETGATPYYLCDVGTWAKRLGKV